MKAIFLAVALAAAALPCAASAQSLGEEGSFQFKTPAERSVAISATVLAETKRGGGFEARSTLGGGGGNGGGGSAANTNNYFQYVDQSVTTNNCSSSGGVGSPMSCGGHAGTTISGTSQVSSGNTQQSHNEVRDNSFQSNGNTTNVTSNGSNSTSYTGVAPVGTPLGR